LLAPKRIKKGLLIQVKPFGRPDNHGAMQFK